MNWLLIVLYCIVNFYIVNFYKNKYEGVFSAPFVMAAISLSVMLPQMTTIYYSNRYDNDLIPLLAYMMISCNIAFAIGYKRGYVKVPGNKILDIRVEKIKYIDKKYDEKVSTIMSSSDSINLCFITYKVLQRFYYSVYCCSDTGFCDKESVFDLPVLCANSFRI